MRSSMANKKSKPGDLVWVFTENSIQLSPAMIIKFSDKKSHYDVDLLFGEQILQKNSKICFSTKEEGCVYIRTGISNGIRF